MVFGALVAAGIPILLAVSAVIAALAVVTISSHWLPVGNSTAEVVLIVGMAVGVDYSLFYLRREREERARGRSFPEALRIAAGTSGRSILVSGLTVMIAMAGLFLTGIDQFTGIAIGTIAVVGMAVAGSLTVLPALLSWLGPRADRGRIPFLGRGRARRPPVPAVGRAGAPGGRPPGDLGRHRHGGPARAGRAGAGHAAGRAGRRRAAGPGRDRDHRRDPAGLPADAVTGRGRGDGPGRHRPPGAGRGRRATGARGGRRSRSASPSRLPRSAAREMAARWSSTSRWPATGRTRCRTRRWLTLRNQILPATLGRVPGISYAVTGDTASEYDFTHQLHDRTPVVLALVAGLAFVLLLIAFRSVGISLVSILLNLLSVGAAYGLITLIFQDGRLQHLLGYTSFGGIIAWVPLFMFVFLFGISMDYHVFILSRIRELWSRGSSAHDAVVGGIASSAGVVTSAALIMVAVFSIFATLPLVDLKILGIGTAAAVLIDATVVRGILVPAALALLGDRAWHGRRALSAERSPARRAQPPRLAHTPVGGDQGVADGGAAVQHGAAGPGPADQAGLAQHGQVIADAAERLAQRGDQLGGAARLLQRDQDGGA